MHLSPEMFPGTRLWQLRTSNRYTGTLMSLANPQYWR